LYLSSSLICCIAKSYFPLLDKYRKVFLYALLQFRYWLTNKCKQYKKKILRAYGLPVYAYDFPVVDWNLYGWVCYSHRAAVIKILTEPLQPASIRRKIKQEVPGMKISVLVKRKWDHRDITSNVIAYKHLHR